MELTPKGRAVLERGRPRRSAVPGSLDFEERCLERFDAKQGSRAPFSLIEGLFRFKTGLDPERQRRLYCDLPLFDPGMVERGKKMVEKDRRTHRTTREVLELRAEIAREIREERLLARIPKVTVALLLSLFVSSCSSPPCGKGPSSLSHAPSTAINPPSRGAGYQTVPSPSTDGAAPTRAVAPQGGIQGASSLSEAPALGITVHSASDLTWFDRPVDGMYSLFGRDARISISADLEGKPDRCRAVCAHEIGHALALAHQAAPDTWMAAKSCYAPPVTWPTDAEIALAKAYTGRLVLTLVDVPPCTARSIRWAAATWNASLGRDAIEVR